MDRIVEHGVRCAALVAGFHAAKTSGIPIGLQKTTSNLFRRREQTARHKLDVSLLGVLSINSPGGFVRRPWVCFPMGGLLMFCPPGVGPGWGFRNVGGGGWVVGGFFCWWWCFYVYVGVPDKGGLVGVLGGKGGFSCG